MQKVESYKLHLYPTERGDLAKSLKGNHTIAIISAIEGYETLETALSDICAEAQRLTSIQVNGMTFPVEYFLGSDLKFFVIVCGIESATCTYACVWAHAHHLKGMIWQRSGQSLIQN